MLSGRRTGKLVALVLTLVASLVPVGASARGESAASSCAIPGDCRLFEAGRIPGVRIGFASSNGTAQHKATLLAEGNVVVNHEFSWTGIEPAKGVWDFTKADNNYQFAVDHGLFQIGMHFAWDQAIVDDFPDWVGAITDPTELRAVLKERAHVIFTRYPKINRIDVINEPFETLGSNLYQNHFYKVLGPDYINELFKIVESEAPSTVQLMVNEGGIEYQPKKAAALVALVAHLRAEGRRVDAVGLQTHMSAGEPNWPVLLTTMQQIAALHVRPFISELDVPVSSAIPDREQVQAERYRHVVQDCLMIPSCDIVNIWGVSDSESWYNGSLYPGLNPLLFDDNYHPKPAYFAVRDALLGGRLAPGSIPSSTIHTLTSGDAAVTYAFECRSGSGPTALADFGYPDLANVTHIFVDGNPIRLAVPAHLTWSPKGEPDGTIHYTATAAVDLTTLVQRYLEDTARPAIGLGGHLDLVNTVWMRIDATHVAMAFSGKTIAMPDLSGDTRTPTGPTSVTASWTVPAPSSTSSTTVSLGPPVLSFDAKIALGVIYQGASVPGGVSGQLTCAATGEVPVAQSVVAGHGADAVGSMTAAAVPVVLTPTFTG